MPGYYNEKKYLFGNPDIEILNEIDNENLLCERRYRREKELYAPLINNYEKFVNKAAKLIKALDLSDDSLSYAIAIERLIRDGNFSINKFGNVNNPKHELDSNYGINIIDGEGCCRHTTDIAHKIITNMGSYTKKFYCYESTISLRNIALNKPATHVINLVKYDDNLCGFDTLNGELYTFYNGSQMRIVSDTIPSYLIYKPYCDMIYEGLSKEEVLKYMRDYLVASRVNPIELNEYNVLYSSINNDITRNKDIIHDFEKDTKVLKKEIHEGIKSIF